ncbi:hypothetical protein HC766_05305 [Candidatus Gracilibacteria bacterium]|nr:hypothetical protein [Candidatus Gracilibacteria bacterium]
MGDCPIRVQGQRGPHASAGKALHPQTSLRQSPKGMTGDKADIKLDRKAFLLL